MAKSPDAFRTISEVAEWLDTPAHVLRFWESKFTQVKPVKRAGGRRYYRPDDMALLGGIKMLLHEQGMTIKGAQKLLREKGIKYVASLGPSPIGESDSGLIEAVAEPVQENVVPLAKTPAPEVEEAEIVAPADPAPAPAEAEPAAVAAEPASPEAASVEPEPAPAPVAAEAKEVLPGVLSLTTGRAPGALAPKAAEIAPLLARLEVVAARMQAG